MKSSVALETSTQHEVLPTSEWSARRTAMLSANFRSAVEALSANHLRSLLTMLGVIIGVAAVIASVMLTQGEAASISANLTRLGTNAVTVSPGSVNIGGANGGAGSLPSLTVADAQALGNVPHVIAISPVVLSFGAVVYGNTNWPTFVDGTSTDYQTIQNWQLAEGSWWNQSQEQAGAPVVLLGQTVVNKTFASKGKDPVGQTVRIGRQLYRVIGVLFPKGAQAGKDLDNVVIVPYTTLIRSRQQNIVNQILVQADSAATLDQVQQSVTTLLEQRHHSSPVNPDDFSISTSNQIIQTAQQSAAALETLLIGVATISLIVGGIGIMNIMLVSVTERTREIGIRMAVGAQPSDIRDQFLVEALTLSTIGGAIGILIGLLAGVVLTLNFLYPLVFSFLAMLLAFCVAALAGVVFGLYPALRASRLDPIVALRRE